MQATILTLFGVCLAAGLAELVLPGEEATGTRRALHFLCALTVLVLLFSPFLRFLFSHKHLSLDELPINEGEITDYETIFAGVLEAQYEKDLHEGLALLLEKEYGIAAEDCEIKTDYRADGSLLRIRIYLRGAAIIHAPEEIEQMLHARFGCIVEVR